MGNLPKTEGRSRQRPEGCTSAVPASGTKPERECRGDPGGREGPYSPEGPRGEPAGEERCPVGSNTCAEPPEEQRQRGAGASEGCRGPVRFSASAASRSRSAQSCTPPDDRRAPAAPVVSSAARRPDFNSLAEIRQPATETISGTSRSRDSMVRSCGALGKAELYTEPSAEGRPSWSPGCCLRSCLLCT